MSESLQEIERLVDRLTRTSIKAGGGFAADDRIMRDEDERKTARATLLSAITRVVQERDARIAVLEKALRETPCMCEFNQVVRTVVDPLDRLHDIKSGEDKICARCAALSTAAQGEGLGLS